MLPHLALTLADLSPLIAGADMAISGTLSAVARVLSEAAGAGGDDRRAADGFPSVAEPPAMRELPLLPSRRRHFGPAVIRLLYAIGSACGRSSLRPVSQLRRQLGLPGVRDELIDGLLRSERISAMYPPAFARLPADAPPQGKARRSLIMTAGMVRPAPWNPRLRIFWRADRPRSSSRWAASSCMPQGFLRS
jgi:rhamnosyltransferase subunit B